MPECKQFKSLLIETDVFKIHHVIEVEVDDDNRKNPISINTYFQSTNRTNGVINILLKEEVERVMALYH